MSVQLTKFYPVLTVRSALVADDDDSWTPDHLERCCAVANDAVQMVISGLIRHEDDDDQSEGTLLSGASWQWQAH
jgi:hypothetical protein